MVLYSASVILLAITTSTAQDAGVPVTTSSQLADALSVMNNAVAIYSTLDSPLEHCFSAELTALRPEDQLATYVFQLQTPLGYIQMPPFCVNLTTSASGEFLFGPCGDLFPDFPANVLYFNGENCIIASVVLFGARQCMMGVTKEFKDSVPEECTQQFDQHCGPKRYTLYSKEECT
uniref:Putative lipocalin-5 1 n=1 Tax=Rhipicephalus microplus TaxID=6941 RepID=A0A6M2CJR1_RHIMP